MKRLIAVICVAVLSFAPLHAQERVETSAGTVMVERMIDRLDQPWAIAFVPGGSVLVTERAGRLLHIGPEGRRAVGGVPRVADSGQGGLLDVVVARDFAETREIFLSYAQPASGGARTALAVARLSDDGGTLENLRVIFQMSEASGAGRHFGSRIVEAHDGTLFLTIGDRGARPKAQDPNAHNGKVIRVARDGSIPADNPFANGGGLPEIWSLGHRNPQGAALDAAGTLWTAAHGARGGDEVNTPQKGRNYGWPVISYGRHYTGGRIGEGTAKPGMEQPLHYWDPSIAPSGMMIYSGRLFPEWRGDIFVGSLKFDMISRLERQGTTVSEAERLFQDRYIRIRDIREAPDGSIWFLSVGDGAAYRVTPG
ncbi:PQQ-dependent sugar dehydrogenase [Oceanibium sediminis]|uniref:PQQ-dependent sugar dehydrogenase n=1 Tax=Oceanibium sediminis TaxID=2026339 RepID=UPI000DD3045C|nr:PQQ-dependent sugar dehydrogenase [Oceanibium sediminis]